MPRALINGLSTKERRDLQEPDEPAQLSPLWDQEELKELGDMMKVSPVIMERVECATNKP